MMDLEQWIYSPHIARWLSAGRKLNLAELMDCILSAPHRTLEEDIRRDYVRELEERRGKGETKRLAEELAKEK